MRPRELPIFFETRRKEGIQSPRVPKFKCSLARLNAAKNA
jgi:hypothetical protein